MKLKNKGVFFFSTRKISALARGLTICCAVAILLAPGLVLSLGNLQPENAAYLVLVFVFAFAILMSLLTRASTERIFVGTCA